MTQGIDEKDIRACTAADFDTIVEIINAAAQAYKGVIPADCWHEPYMSGDALQSEIKAGVRFVGFEIDGKLAGIMGIQTSKNVDLIRHAYVAPAFQGRGLGSRMMDYLRSQVTRPLLVGTWQAATWAIGFYERHGFKLAPSVEIERLLRTYWHVSDRQIETSVVLALPSLDEAGVAALIPGA